MGCRICSGPPQELFCRACNDWASIKALEFHGPIVKDGEKRSEMLLFLHSIVLHLNANGKTGIDPCPQP